MCTKPPEFIMVFDPPPLDLPLEYVLDFHLQNNPDHVAITYPREDGNDLKSYTYKELIPAIHRAGQLIVEDAGISESLLHTSPVVAIVIKTGTSVNLSTCYHGSDSCCLATMTDSVTYLTVIAVISFFSWLMPEEDWFQNQGAAASRDDSIPYLASFPS